ncbi:MAG: putative transport system permease protein [Gaiellaceae bacterium]|nr:putative transport system permease protein [Gaiellaceae bacterium]
MPRALWAKAPFVLAQHRAVLLAVIVASFLVAMAASSAPLLRAGAESEALKGKLELLTPLAAGLTIENHSPPGSPAADRARRAAAQRFGRRLPFVRSPILTTTSFAQVGKRTDGSAASLFVVPMARTDATAHVDRLLGGGSAAWIPGSIAKATQVAPGRNLQLIAAATERRSHAVTVPVGAIYRALEADRGNPYWVNFTVRIRSRSLDQPPPPPFVLMRQSELYRVVRELGGADLENTFEFPVAPEAITPGRARRIADAFSAARRELARPTTLAESLGCGTTQATRCSVTSSLEAAVVLARQSVAALTPVILLLASFAGLIAVGAAFVAGTFNVRRRAGESRLSVVLGERRGTFAARAALEALLPAIVGAAAGLGTAALLVRLFTPAGTVDRSVVGSALLAAIGAAVVAVAAVAAGAWAARGRTLDRPTRARRVGQIPWELPALAAAVGLYAIVRRGGGLVSDATAGSHPRLIVLLVPLFLAAALAGLGLRLVRRGLRRSDSRSDLVYLALRRITAPRALATMLTVTAAVSFGALAFSELLGSSLSSNSAEKAYVANGSDVQGLIDAQQTLPQAFPYPITKVVQSFNTVSVDGSAVEALAVDPASLVRVIRWPWPDDPRGAVRALLASHAPLPAIASAGLRHATSVEVGGRRLPITVVATVHAFPGRVAGDQLLVLPQVALERAAARAGVVGDPLDGAYAFVWARGGAAGIQSALARSPIAPEYVTTVRYFLESAELTTAARTYGFLRVIALGAALVALVALLLYLHARARAQLVTGALLERMGMSRSRQAGSVALEAGSLVAFAMLAGAASALLAAGPLIARVDPLPQYAPGASLVVPWTLLVVSLVGLTVIAAAAAALAAALAARAEVGEALRVA